MEDEAAVYFYGANNSQGYLSNLHKAPFVEDGVTYIMPEQYMLKKRQEMFDPDNEKLAQQLVASHNPTRIQAYGRHVRFHKPFVWDQVKYGLLKRAYLLKFSQHPELEGRLLATGDKAVYMCRPNDREWGVGLDIPTALRTDPVRYGRNMMGKVLVEVRAELRAQRLHAALGAQLG